MRSGWRHGPNLADADAQLRFRDERFDGEISEVDNLDAEPRYAAELPAAPAAQREAMASRVCREPHQRRLLQNDARVSPTCGIVHPRRRDGGADALAAERSRDARQIKPEQ